MHLQEFQDYLTLEKHYSIHTCTSYINDLNQFIASLEIHGVDLDEANYSMVRQWMSDLMEAGISSRTINRKVSSLKAYFKYLRIQGYRDDNIMSLHKSLKTSKKVQVPFSQKEIRAFLSVVFDESSFEDIRDRAIIELLYVTGMRRAELINLTSGNVDFNKGKIKVLGKRNKERIIPLLDSTCIILKQYVRVKENDGLSISDYFFVTRKGQPVYSSLIYRIVTSKLKKASVKFKVSPHVLRHTFATHLLDQGADLNAVKELLGHASLASTQVYTHTSMQALKDSHAKSHPRNNKSPNR